MKTVGQILKSARAEKQISVEQAEIATKIRVRHIQALEEDDYGKFPEYTSARGFLKNYAEFLGLSALPILAVFRRDFTKAKIVEPIIKERIRWVPKHTIIVVSLIFFLGLVSYLGFQYLSLVKRPFLEITDPQEGKQVSSGKIEAVGRASPDALVTLNGNPVLLSPKGEFRYQIELFPGENKIVVEAKSRMGKVTRMERKVFRLDKQR